MVKGSRTECFTVGAEKDWRLGKIYDGKNPCRSNSCNDEFVTMSSIFWLDLSVLGNVVGSSVTAKNFFQSLEDDTVTLNSERLQLECL